MRITETKKVIREQIEEVTIERVCDCCGEVIRPVQKHRDCDEYNYFLITTCHHDWGNDSCDSYESYDACSPECAVELAQVYLYKAYEGTNTKEIRIEHVRSLNDGSKCSYKRDAKKELGSEY